MGCIKYYTEEDHFTASNYHTSPKYSRLKIPSENHQGPPYDKHHIYPKKFRTFFEKKGLNINFPTVPVEYRKHQREANAWNSAWEKWIGKYGDDATHIHIAKFGLQLMQDFGYTRYETAYDQPFRSYWKKTNYLNSVARTLPHGEALGSINMLDGS